MHDHDHCDPAICKVAAGEAVENRQAGMEMDDGMPTKCCRNCLLFGQTPMEMSLGLGWCTKDDRPTDFDDSCLAFELRTF